MRDSVEFLRGLAGHFDTVSIPEQEAFVRHIERSIGNHEGALLLEADGGIGKTIGFLVCGMQESINRNMPMIVATSTITNRDQIKTEHGKIVEYAGTRKDALADVPLFNYRNERDYVHPERLKTLIERLAGRAPASVIAQLREIETRLTNGESVLLETVMPHDITGEEVEGSPVIVRRSEIACHLGDKGLPDQFIADRLEIDEHIDQPCVIVMTHAMLAMSKKFQDMIAADRIALVVVDEVDKLTTIDFVSFTSIVLSDIAGLLDEADARAVDVSDARRAFATLRRITGEIKSISPDRERNTLLIHDRIGEARTKAVHSALMALAVKLNDLATVVDNMPITDWPSELTLRRLFMGFEELAHSTKRLCGFMYPHGLTERDINFTDLEVFFSWDEEDEFRVVSARPGALVAWLFHYNVPVVLTTAFLGEPDRWFARKIGLPMYRLTRESAIRSIRYGSLKFIYFNNLNDAVHADSNVGHRAPNPAHFDDLDRMLRTSPWSWEPGRRIVVLTPGYLDIHEIQARLQKSGSNAPFFPHLRGTNINEIRDKFIASEQGGILLTVYWEGFNIVGHDTDRRGLIDVLVMSRIPFQRPNRMLESLHEHLGYQRQLVFRDLQIEAKRRIHQGFNRVIRGPEDRGVVLICDSRFPPPAVLTDETDLIAPQHSHVDLLEAIPERFRFRPECFDLVDAQTWESLL